MADIEAGTTTVGVAGLVFPVFDRGEGTVVVLLHGFPDSRHLWRYQIPPLLEAGLRVVAPDLRGFGDAPKPKKLEGYAIPNVANEILGILDVLGIAEFYLVGHDWGAAVSWYLAAQFPDRVKRLVALSVGCPGNSGTTSYEQLELAWYAFVFGYGQHVEELVRANDWEFLRNLLRGNGDQERYFQDLSRPGALEAALNWYRANMIPNFEANRPAPLPRILCPVLGVWSDGDAYLAEQSVERSVECLDGPWEYKKLTGASHWMMLDKKEELSRILVDFLRE